MRISLMLSILSIFTLGCTDSSDRVPASLINSYRDHYCGTINGVQKGEKGIYAKIFVSSHQEFHLTSEDVEIQNTLKDFNNTQGCVYSNNATVKTLKGDLFIVQHVSTGVIDEDCNCPNDYSPVCDAKNRKTYNNPCLASCAGVFESDSGPCYY